jgi:basic membrane lipoprotein Med (substrate-binding protein (PBP1-ABC) superfamily)
MRINVGGLLVMLSMSVLVATGCGEDSDGGGGDSDVRAHWLYTGPEDDGGYNIAMEKGQAAMEDAGAQTTATFELPYSQRSTQVAEQAIAQGSNVVVDTLGLSTLITDVCRENSDVYCFAYADPAEQPPNSRSYTVKNWEQSYVAGVAAGLMTETNELGFIGSFDVPLVRMTVNSYALGCQSVNPDCKVRVVYTNSYFDPPKETQAAVSMIDAGADVLKVFVDSPAFCQAAQNEGVLAVGDFIDFKETCPDSIIVSTFWDYEDYFKEQTEAIADGTFKGGGFDFIEASPELGEFGDFVPDDVRQQIEDAHNRVVDGEDVIVGPISDQNGQVRFKEGEVPSDKFLLGQWSWYVNGIIGR